MLKKRSWVHIAVMAAAFLATFVWNVNVIFIILAAAAVGICTELWKHRASGPQA